MPTTQNSLEYAQAEGVSAPYADGREVHTGIEVRDYTEEPKGWQIRYPTVEFDLSWGKSGRRVFLVHDEEVRALAKVLAHALGMTLAYEDNEEN
jgi:hypothetical protein